MAVGFRADDIFVVSPGTGPTPWYSPNAPFSKVIVGRVSRIPVVVENLELRQLLGL
jgi:hypothetical protein